MQRTLGQPPTLIEFWDRTYTPKDTPTMSSAALAIRVVRGDHEPLDSTVPPPEITLSLDEEITLWVASQDPPSNITSKYQLLGQPQIQAYTFPRVIVNVREYLLGHIIRALSCPTIYFRGLWHGCRRQLVRNMIFHQHSLPTRARWHQLVQDIAARVTAKRMGIS